MPTRKNAHMYNSFKIVTGMSAFVKNSAKTEGNITKTSYLNKKCMKKDGGQKNNQGQKKTFMHIYLFNLKWITYIWSEYK